MGKGRIGADGATCTAAVSACEKGTQSGAAIVVFDSLQLRVEPTQQCWNALISAQEAEFNWARALWALQAMRDRGLRGDVLSHSSAVTACGKRKRWQRALGIFAAMPDSPTAEDSVALVAVMCACSHGKQWERALALLGAAQCPDAEALETAVRVCSTATHWQVAQRLHAVLEPSPLAYEAMAAGYENAAEWGRALSLLDCMPRARIRPTLASAASVITACHRSLMWQRAWDAARLLEVRDPELGRLALGNESTVFRLWRKPAPLQRGWPLAPAYDSELRKGH
eukprot:TRINITY_DN24493_c1_g2_i1.p1 TRINITY_DN24493_c1_g2~~TRINITY_DN24493_c1_g2_i1.p1  ORF type:complete len:283 (+),score=77.93 TRINITY_DN24493_c1_g2_i1:272-1120(+)